MCIDWTLYLDTWRVISTLRKHNRPYSLLKSHGLRLIFRCHQHLLAWFWAAHEDLIQNINFEESSYNSNRNICRVWEQQRYLLYPSSFKRDAIKRRELLRVQQKNGRQLPREVAEEISTGGEKSLLKAGLSTAQRSDRITIIGSL